MLVSHWREPEPARQDYGIWVHSSRKNQKIDLELCGFSARAWNHGVAGTLSLAKDWPLDHQHMPKNILLDELPTYDMWRRVPTHLRTATSIRQLRLALPHEAPPVAIKIGGYAPYKLYDTQDLKPLPPKPQLSDAPKRRRYALPARISLAIQSVSRHAHRSENPGQGKHLFALKTDALRWALKSDGAELVAQQLVNGRACASVKYGGLRHHLPVEQLPNGYCYADLPELPAMAVSEWPAPAMNFAQATTCLKRIGLRIPFPVTCLCCGENWRWDRQGQDLRVCPQCFNALQRCEYEQEDWLLDNSQEE